MDYGYRKNIQMDFPKALAAVKKQLAQEGFGVLTEIDVQATLKNKLDIAYGNYVILGACNPPLAYQALQAEKEVGLLLPCNVIVYQENDKTFVSAILPTVAMGMVENPPLADIAKTVEGKLKKVIDAL